MPKRKSKAIKSPEVAAKKANVVPEAGSSSGSVSGTTIPIDSGCKWSNNDDYLVYCDATDGVMNAMLNQTNISQNNNKFYTLQVITKRGEDKYWLWLRWGRIGRTVGSSLETQTSKEQAVGEFKKKFRAKTGNTWEARENFVKKKGKYDLIQVDYDEKADDVKASGDDVKAPEIRSKLDEKLRDLMMLIFDVKEWERSMSELGFDVKKSPLGKLTKLQVRAGYESLKKIADIVNTGGGNRKAGLEAACSEFYTRIPHNFGMRRPTLITTPQQVKEKIHLLESLDDIQIGIELMKTTTNDHEEPMNPVDANYKSLNCDLKPLPPDHANFRLIEEFVANTHAQTHSGYKLRVLDAFDVNRTSDNARFRDDIEPKMLLWHGSRLMNWCGILGQGLRIAPPEAPVSGYMFGKGIYFADMVSKSANYCRSSKRKPIGLMLLCEVAVGDMNEKLGFDYNAARLPKGKHSTKGVGNTAPDQSQAKLLDGGQVKVPLGKPKCNNVEGATLLYNEYIVYDVKQVKPRFLVKLKFDFKY